ncbi:MAG TPA: HAD family phosphatase [Bacteroidia bacterium]|nr:HAD family phosphatase [Bacteroidia bacterium]
MDFTGIKNIIFDLGGVLINLDPTLTHRAFEKAGAVQVAEHFTFTHQHTLIKEFEVGRMDAPSFRQMFCGIFNTVIQETDFDAAWNAMLLDVPAERLELLRRLKSRYNIYLLSNTNFLHHAFIIEYLRATHGIDNFDAMFHKAYYSHTLGLRKPDAAIYRHVLDENKLNPSETLFFDDNAANIEGAKAVGIQSVLVDKEIVEYFTV